MSKLVIMNKVPVIIEALGYILSKLKSVDKLKLVKLLYLADKYHLMHYGRTISRDTFYALPHGPAGSQTMDVLEFDPSVLGDCLGKAKNCFKQSLGHSYIPGEKCGPNFDMLSESDIEALDYVIDIFGKKFSTWKIREYTHSLKEWKQFKHLIETKKSKQEFIKTVDLFSPSNDDFFSPPGDHLDTSRKIFNGELE